jgi:hypothetical protein
MRRLLWGSYTTFDEQPRNYAVVKLPSFLENMSYGTATILETLGMKSAIKERLAWLVGRGVVPSMLLAG